MPLSKWYQLAMALDQGLRDELPGLIAEINVLIEPSIAIVAPLTIDLGVRTEMLDRDLASLPALSTGVYDRIKSGKNMELEQKATHVSFPYIIEMYLGDMDIDVLYKQAIKWACLFDQFIEQFGDKLVKGFVPEEAPDISITYALDQRKKGYRQLITVEGFFIATE